MEARQLAVVPSAVPAGLEGAAKGDSSTSRDLWSNFCAIARGGGELALAAATAGVSVSAKQQLRFMSLCIYLSMCVVVLSCCTEFGYLMSGDGLRRAGCFGGADLAFCFQEEMTRGYD